MGLPAGDSLSVLAAVATDVVDLRVVGVLDHWTVENLVATAREHLAGLPPGGTLRLDLERCTFCDSAGLTGLFAVWKWGNRTRVSVRLDNRPDFLDRLLRLTGLGELIT